MENRREEIGIFHEKKKKHQGKGPDKREKSKVDKKA